MHDAAPLILTLAFDAATFARFDGERRRHFPAALNHIPAHATLFHHLPGADAGAVADTVSALARALAPPEVSVTELRFTGRGVAYVLDCTALAGFRGQVAARFAGRLTAQDRQGWRPHVTVQNKVAPEAARALHDDLRRGFSPFRFTAPAALLWRYRGGPWDPVACLPFRGDA